MTEKKIETLDAYPIQMNIPVAWGDMDAMQHVNNVVYFRYMETARIHFLEHVGLLQYVKEHQVGVVVADQKCKYIRPVTYPDQLTLGVQLNKVQSDSFELKYLVYSKAHSNVAALGTSNMVCWDIRNQQRFNLSDSMQAQIQRRSTLGG